MKTSHKKVTTFGNRLNNGWPDRLIRMARNWKDPSPWTLLWQCKASSRLWSYANSTLLATQPQTLVAGPTAAWPSLSGLRTKWGCSESAFILFITKLFFMAKIQPSYRNFSLEGGELSFVLKSYMTQPFEVSSTRQDCSVTAWSAKMSVDAKEHLVPGPFSPGPNSQKSKYSTSAMSISESSGLGISF